MLTLLPMLTQVIAVVVWAMFLIMVGAPLAAGPALGREGLGSKPEPADPSPIAREKGRPSRPAPRGGRAIGERCHPDRATARPLSRCRSR